MSMKKESPLDIALHQASKIGDEESLVTILQSGRVYVDCYDEDGATPLMLAIVENFTDCVLALLKEGADPNMRKKNGLRPLMMACQRGNKQMVKQLISHGAEIDAINKDGGTALMFACQYGFIELAEQLIENGCNIHKAMHDGTTALFLAAQSGYSEIVWLLIHACRERNRNVAILLVAPRRDGASPLFIASQMGHFECVRILLENGAEVDQCRIDDVTPLFKACHKGHLAIVKELIKYNANIGVLQNGESCLHAAALSGDLWTVRALLRMGTDANVINREGKSALDLAIQAGHQEPAKLIRLFMKATSAPAIRKLQSDLALDDDEDFTLPQIKPQVRFNIQQNEDNLDKKKSESCLISPQRRIQCQMLDVDSKLQVKSPTKLNKRRYSTNI